MIETIMEIFGLIMFISSIFSLLKYIVLNKIHPNSLKTFSISVIAFFIFSAFFCLVETILYYKVRFKHKVDGQVVFYIIMSVLYLWNVIVLYYIASFRMILKEEYFIYYNIFGIKKKYYYIDVVDLKTDPVSGYIKITLKKKKIEIPYFIDGQLEILDHVKVENSN